jgi:hypothetical protein
MMANREVVNTEMGAYRDSAETEECSQPMDDIQVSPEQVSLQRPDLRIAAVFTVNLQRSWSFLPGEGLEV